MMGRSIPPHFQNPWFGQSHGISEVHICVVVLMNKVLCKVRLLAQVLSLDLHFILMVKCSRNISSSSVFEDLVNVSIK